MNIENNTLGDDNNPLKFVFHHIDDPSHYSNIFIKENFKLLEKWGLVQKYGISQISFQY